MRMYVCAVSRRIIAAERNQQGTEGIMINPMHARYDTMCLRVVTQCLANSRTTRLLRLNKRASEPRDDDLARWAADSPLFSKLNSSQSGRDYRGERCGSRRDVTVREGRSGWSVRWIAYWMADGRAGWLASRLPAVWWRQIALLLARSAASHRRTASPVFRGVPCAVRLIACLLCPKINKNHISTK
jgi:hypothetical protein